MKESMDCLFNDGKWRMLDQKSAINIISHSTNKKYIALKGKMGAGKTEGVIESFNALDETGTGAVLYIVGRRDLAKEIEDRIGSKSRVYNYLNKDDFARGIILAKNGRLELRSVFVVCINSINADIFGSDDHFKTDMIVIDEIETTIGNLLNDNLIDYERALDILDYIETGLFHHTNTLITIDAAHTESLASAIHKIFGLSNRLYKLELTTRVKPIYRTAIECTAQLNVHDMPTKGRKRKRKDLSDDEDDEVQLDEGEYTQESILSAILHHVYKLGNRVAISVPYPNKAEEIKNRIIAARPSNATTIPHVVLYTAPENVNRANRVRMGSKESLDMKDLAKEADVFIFNSCMSAGHSIDIPGYSAFFTLFSVADNTCGILEQIQMTARFRRNQSGKLYYGIIRVEKDPLGSIRKLGKLENYSERLKKFGRTLGSSEWHAKRGIQCLLEMSYPGITFKKGLIKNTPPVKKMKNITTTLKEDMKVTRDLIMRDDIDKWRYICKGKPIYGIGKIPKGIKTLHTRTKKYRHIVS